MRNDMQRNAKFLADYWKQLPENFVLSKPGQEKNAVYWHLGQNPKESESYQLKEVTGDGITITAPTEAGVFYGIQSA